MTKRVGNKDQAQHRSKAEKAATRKTNIAREAVKQALARTRYRNAQKGAPLAVLALPPA